MGRNENPYIEGTIMCIQPRGLIIHLNLILYIFIKDVFAGKKFSVTAAQGNSYMGSILRQQVKSAAGIRNRLKFQTVPGGGETMFPVIHQRSNGKHCILSPVFYCIPKGSGILPPHKGQLLLQTDISGLILERNSAVIIKVRQIPLAFPVDGCPQLKIRCHVNCVRPFVCIRNILFVNHCSPQGFSCMLGSLQVKTGIPAENFLIRF